MKTTLENFKKVALALTLVFAVTAFVNAQTRTMVKTTDLQKSITDHIAQNYAGYTVKNAYKIDHNKVITYEVDVAKDNQMVRLNYDNSGKFLKVVEPKMAHAEHTANKPKTEHAAKPAPKPAPKTESTPTK